jgi:serine/threonine protein kinase
MRIPEKISKYDILGVAGRGNMGTVYTGYDSFADRDVAIKVCAIDANARKEAAALTRKMFLNEAQIAGGLDHPNILRVLDAGEHEGEPYIVMEHVGGSQTLKDFCHPDKLLPVKTVAEVIFKCARALDYAHRRGVTHCDIKPSNIMLTPEKDVKIGDFGIARLSLPDITQVMGLLGSPRYMSPEQIQETEITNQTDIYSLGVVMHELLTGTPPFDARALSQLINLIVNDPPPLVSSVRSNIPPGLDSIVQHALAKGLSERYRMGSEFASELAAVFSELELARSALSDDEKFSMIRDLEFFDEFNDAEVHEVVGASSWETYSPGDCVISEGSLDVSFYIIATGDVAVTKESKELCTLTRGDCFGEMGYVSKKVPTASIVARDEVSLLKISDSLMQKASTECQLRFTRAFVRTLINRLTRVSEDLSTDLAQVAIA